MEKELFQKALTLLQQKGTEALPEDKLPDMLGISEDKFKKTFGSKKEMVSKLVEFDLAQSDEEAQEIIRRSDNTIEGLFTLLQISVDKLKTINPNLVKQIQEDYPEAWDIYQAHNINSSYYTIYDLINKGIIEQDLRKDINIELVTKIILAQSNVLFNPVMFPPERYNLAEVFRSIYMYYIRGICTEKGAKTSEHFFSNLKA